MLNLNKIILAIFFSFVFLTKLNAMGTMVSSPETMIQSIEEHYEVFSNNAYWEIDKIRVLLNKHKLKLSEIANDLKQTPLHLACEKGNLGIVQIILLIDPKNALKLIEAIDINGQTALDLALDNNNKDIVSAIITMKNLPANLSPCI